MITIKIGNNLREYSTIRDLDEGWVLQQINERRRAGESVDVHVKINQHPIQISLATPNVLTGGGGGRQPNEAEQTAFNLWNECGLNAVGFAPGRLIEFLKKMANILR